MAKQMVFVDDLTGEAGARTRVVVFDGTTYEIDLTDTSFDKMRDTLRPFLEAGRVSKNGSRAASNGHRSKAPVRKPTQLADSPSTIRAWADANGVACPRRGRIPSSVVSAYELAKGMGKAS